MVYVPGAITDEYAASTPGGRDGTTAHDENVPVPLDTVAFNVIAPVVALYAVTLPKT